MSNQRNVPLGILSLVAALLPVVALSGCGSTNSDTAAKDAPAGDPPVSVAPVDTAEPTITVAELRRRLRAGDRAEFRTAGGEIRFVSLFQAGVKDITPLEGLSLTYLDLTGSPISDLSPLTGMPLEELYLESTEVNDVSLLAGMPLRILRMEHTPVEDISPLAGMGIQQLNLFDTQVADIGPVADMPLQILWLSGTKVENLDALAEKSLESLDIQDTSIADLQVLKTMTSLKRLNIAGSAVSDLTPLAGLSLERLIFSPQQIEKGIDVIRSMSTLQNLGPSFDAVTPPAEFWKAYDAGQFEGDVGS